MLQAAGMYNTLLKGNDPALVVEVLNAYRLKEKIPQNLDEYYVKLGEVDILRKGKDITVVSYGACLGVIQHALPLLEKHGIDIELIDVQTLLPFDRGCQIVASLKKTNAILFVDEDVPGGATSYMFQQVLEKENGYDYLDAQPRTLTAKAHRSPYGSDGDYYTKPNVNDVFESIYLMMHERKPNAYPALKIPL
jgi:pyruvate/2-oxoglutarate/acetoin dehydrogenase E1 component